MATLMCKLKIKEGMEGEYEHLQRGMYAPTVAGAKNTLYHTFRSENPREYYCLMSFTDYPAFIRHVSSDHHEIVNWFDYFEDASFHWLEPLEGASNLPGLTDFHPMENPTELERKYIDFFFRARPDWWPKLPADSSR